MAEQEAPMAERRLSGLAPAHSGYMYQDLITAYFLARAVIESYPVRVDRKNFSGDLFDDLTLGTSRKIQLKSSLNDSLAFELEDLSTMRRNTRIDHLLHSMKEDGFSAQEYRLCATWTRATDPRLSGFLERIDSESSFAGFDTVLYRLRPTAFGAPDAGRLGTLLSSYTPSEIRDFCDRFRLELECPRASLDLASPGPLESMVLDTLSLGIGVGQFPNQDLQVIDTAATLIYSATLARANQKTVLPNETIVRLRLRTDYGRISQKFPINQSLLVERKNVLDALARFASGNSVTVVTGEPGAGKSWLLTQLTERWASSGVTAIRHYCYLEPTDRDVQRRVTSRLMFGNLTAELVDSRPDLRSGSSPMYAATAESFESLLAATSEDDLIFLVVDGIDHISRVFYQSTGLAAEDIDIVEQLSLLGFPPNVHLIVGSQPGQHLAPLTKANNVFSIPPWGETDVESLVRKTTLGSALTDSGHADSLPDVVSEIFRRAEGNPLYATFVIRELLSRISAGQAIDLPKFLQDIPLRNGDLKNYYEHLFRRISEHQSVSFVETLALLDFGVSREDMEELFPADAHRLSSALVLLRPILERLPTQGGFRIYHESFRRFVTEKLIAQGASIEKRLEPVCSWLEQRGFLKDSRAYRFLLPSLRRAGKNAALLGKITATFMTESLGAGHSPTAISYNLVVAAEAAAKTQDWPALARINELQRANATYVEERMGGVAMYGRAFGELRGAAALSERLLFEGRPTFAREPGLLLCEICDRDGVVPPWSEYLRLPGSDAGRSFDEVDIALAEYRAIARLRGADRAVEILIHWAIDSQQQSGLLNGALKCLRSIFEAPVLDQLTTKELPDSLREALAFEKLQSAKRAGDQQQTAALGNAIILSTSDLSIIARAINLGASTEGLASSSLPRLDSFDLQDVYRDAIPNWLSCLTILARTNRSQLPAERLRVAGEGWYRHWLQFAVSVAEAAAIADHDRNEARQLAMHAFDLLIEDTRPFVGTPRACDLQPIGFDIFESIRTALDLLDQDPGSFSVVLPKLVRVSEGTTTFLHNMESGPLDTEALFNLLTEFVEHPPLTDLILSVLQQQRASRRATSGSYTALSVQELQLCHAYARLNRIADAETHWVRACADLSAYGGRKDITLSELLEGQLTLAKVEGAAAADLVQRSQPLVHEVVSHTDGKGTSGFPVDWFESLCQTRPIQAASLLSLSLVRSHGIVDWRLEKSIEVLLVSQGTKGDPFVLNALWSTLFAEKPTKTMDSRMAVLDRLKQMEPELGRECFRRFASEVQGDSPSVAIEDLNRIRAQLEELGEPLPANLGAFSTEKRTHERTGRVYASPPKSEIPLPWFSSNASALELLAQVRKADLKDDERLGSFVNALGYRLLSLLENCSVDQIELLLKQIAKDTFSERKLDIVYGDLAAGFERFDQLRLAALCYALAFTRTRGAGGWLAFGGEKRIPMFKEAVRLAPNIAYGLLTEECFARIDGMSYVAGLSQHLVALFSSLGDPDQARALWIAICEVIETRFPRESDTFSPIEHFDATVPDSVSLNTALTRLLLSRIVHPDLRRKRAALAGAAYLLQRDPHGFGQAASEFLNSQDSFTTLLALLVLMKSFERPPYLVTQAMAQRLEALAAGDSFGACQFARSLLERSGASANFTGREYVPLPSVAFTQSKEHAILSLDHSERIDNIERIWPNYPRILAQYFEHQQQSDPDNLEIEERRLRLIEDPADRRLPRPPVLHWSSELFEIALHRTLNHLDVELWRQGRPNASLLNEVARGVSPNVSMYVRWWLSRAPRPDIPLPSRLTEETELLGPLPGTDQHAGWIRVAMDETEYVRNQASVLSDIQSVSQISAGMMILPPGETERPSGSLPFGMGDLISWGETVADKPLFRAGPLVSMDYLTDFLGVLPLLILPRQLTGRLGLIPSELLGKLQLDDATGIPAVIFRQWHLRPLGEGFSRSADRNSGCDLIVRPDIWKAIQGLFPHDEVLPQIYRKTEGLA